TWSCYSNGDLACGVCDSCRLRLAAFDELGLTDPVGYEVKSAGI
ncbi:MAG: 7-cyano-7-deazaguanine synthase, partial [Cyanobacteria bacterium J06649_11]